MKLSPRPVTGAAALLLAAVAAIGVSVARTSGPATTAGPRFPLMFRAVPESTPYAWANRYWYTGTFTWRGNVTCSRANVPGAATDTGWSLKVSE